MATLEFANGLSQLLLGFVFMNVGGLKYALGRQGFAGRAGHWMDDIPEFGLRMLGALEVMAGAAVVLPLVFNLPAALVTTAAAFMILVMVGGTVVHLRRSEWGRLVLNLALAAMAAMVLLTYPGG